MSDWWKSTQAILLPWRHDPYLTAFERWAFFFCILMVIVTNGTGIAIVLSK